MPDTKWIISLISCLTTVSSHLDTHVRHSVNLKHSSPGPIAVSALPIRRVCWPTFLQCKKSDIIFFFLKQLVCKNTSAVLSSAKSQNMLVPVHFPVLCSAQCSELLWLAALRSIPRSEPLSCICFPIYNFHRPPALALHFLGSVLFMDPVEEYVMTMEF